MAKNILVVTGSPRKGGNSDALAEAFIKGAQEAGHTVSRFDAGRRHVGACKACDTCWSKGTPCSFDDDFNTEFAPLLEQAEVIVLSMPLYFYGFPAQIKAPLDRMYAYSVPQKHRDIAVKESALLICGGDTTEPSFGGAVECYRQMANYCGWQDRGALVAPGVSAKGDIAKTDYLQQAEAMGRSI